MTQDNDNKNRLDEDKELRKQLNEAIMLVCDYLQTNAFYLDLQYDGRHPDKMKLSTYLSETVDRILESDRRICFHFYQIQNEGNHEDES